MLDVEPATGQELNLFFFQISVYPQKQQPSGPYGYAAYPGPAAYYGSQYGLPYNQY